MPATASVVDSDTGESAKHDLVPVVELRERRAPHSIRTAAMRPRLTPAGSADATPEDLTRTDKAACMNAIRDIREELVSLEHLVTDAFPFLSAILHEHLSEQVRLIRSRDFNDGLLK